MPDFETAGSARPGNEACKGHGRKRDWRAAGPSLTHNSMENEVQVHAEPARAAGEPFLLPEAEPALGHGNSPSALREGISCWLVGVYLTFAPTQICSLARRSGLIMGVFNSQVEFVEFGRVSPNI